MAGSYGAPGEIGGVGTAMAGTATLAGVGRIVGGQGRYAVYGAGTGYYAGTGGAGVAMAAGAILATSGTIVGGMSSAARSGQGLPGIAAMVGQAFTSRRGASLTNTGTITGGYGYFGSRRRQLQGDYLLAAGTIIGGSCAPQGLGGWRRLERRIEHDWPAA